MPINSVTLVGRAGRDPEVKYFESGTVVANLTMAVNRRNRDDEPDWFNLEIWGKQAQVAADHVKKGSLIGITGSFKLEDKNDWFFNNTLTPLINSYGNMFEDQWRNAICSDDNIVLQYAMRPWWVNYQKQYEFNPCHDHTGVYSFVIWLKIPVEFDDQNRDCDSNFPVRSAFQFHYQNILGETPDC